MATCLQLRFRAVADCNVDDPTRPEGQKRVIGKEYSAEAGGWVLSKDVDASVVTVETKRSVNAIAFLRGVCADGHLFPADAETAALMGIAFTAAVHASKTPKESDR